MYLVTSGSICGSNMGMEDKEQICPNRRQRKIPNFVRNSLSDAPARRTVGRQPGRCRQIDAGGVCVGRENEESTEKPRTRNLHGKNEPHRCDMEEEESEIDGAGAAGGCSVLWEDDM